MKYTELAIPDVVLMEPNVFGDHRGFFMETFREDEFNEKVRSVRFVQDNHSMSRKGILRGLHYQIEHPQGKLVRVIQGQVFDVAVDIRKSSPYFGQWVGEILTEENNRMLWVPPGFAHGFYVLSDTAQFIYKCTDYYAPKFERSILWSDQTIGIQWPGIEKQTPVLSQKDEQGVRFQDAEVFA
ncbi:dTDP-4-dehydrorhamnose 3,5-epimerase [Desulfobacter hydrogenophilus]|uniref:dTDP-4-dehydrorhamnose 3,5-epimerase n=1 Tax=Desulfobacter hydrogenophilus TaxID=2291 RepID=A0A328F622_9BACT|nr:dTDP-4-dehydrorhamnose 3,5-epimerase [Desulfobacter hydrogenophilus]NDY74515.1 dTDP-4-dehydrorhamnose 3,5-epimerase [Desulfobacter hydrogenophilus]QBH15063.1 dTDP-4-dehydrorhamnose 3,5-epimerase [Desulfobacter hydrogenophilus]RAL99917.1 dTDP-4-dehydrorhamnose 3,5-epimerase [Desulfobacter hydrogenophilus]